MDHVPEIRFGDDRARSPGQPAEFIGEPWFRAIYSQVEDWYRVRYGARAGQRGNGIIRGVSLVAGTAFELRVPITVTEPGRPGETVWLSFPDRVLPTDDPSKWIVTPPDWSTYSADIVSDSRSTATTVAGLLRRISSRLMGAQLEDATVRSLLAGIRLHLQGAATLILNTDEEGSFARAQWELQMACEVAYKGLRQQQTGAFLEKHDLFLLHDSVTLAQGSVRRQWLSELPRWHEAANLRYGLGDHPTVAGMFHWYLTTLMIVAGICENLKGLNLTQAQFEIGKAPWLANPSNDAPLPA